MSVSEQSGRVYFIRTTNDLVGKPELSGSFPDRKPSHILNKISLLEEKINNGEVVLVGRDLFGPGTFGDYAFNVIVGNATCGTFLDNDRSKKCGKQAWLTVDYDVKGDGDVLPVCSLEHFQEAERGINADLQNQGLYSYIGINGFGRERA